jgi:hypothetical protein
MNNDFSSGLNAWALHDTLTVVQAALLIANIDPAECQDYVIKDKEINRPANFTAYFEAIKNSIRAKKIEANLELYIGYGQSGEEINWSETTIAVDELKAWLLSNNFKPVFFFGENSKEPGYLNKKSPYYAPKLAAAIRAWEAVSTNKKYKDNGKTPKQNLMHWLKLHAAEYDLIKEDGEINVNAIEEQVSKVANWNDKGGASKTPSR